MSNGDDETAQEESQGQDEGQDQDVPVEDEGATVESLDSRLDEAESQLEAAETEADLDDVDATLDEIADDLEAADLPEPDAKAEDEDEDRPRARLETRLEEVREAVEDARGPYAEDVSQKLESAAEEIRDTRWTETGETEVAQTVEDFLDSADEHLEADVSADEHLEADVSADGEAVEALAATLEDVAGAVEDADLDPDEDGDTIGALLEAAEELSAGLEDAETWDDLTVREQLAARGFYDRLTSENRRDFPPELNVVRIAERENDPERVLMALEKLGSDFMEENCIDALRRMGPPEAYDAMIERAQKRDQPAVEVLGKIGDERAVETLVEFIQDESNPPLQKVTLGALGEIGSEEATGDVADRLVAEDPAVRSAAARSLGCIGDTRAVEPLAAVLDDDEEPAEVRASAAWALVQVGTERALDAAAEYADHPAHILQHEAEKAREALGGDEAEATA